METAIPGAGRAEGDELDMAKAKTDPAYFAEIMRDPHKKKAYNDHLIQHTRL